MERSVGIWDLKNATSWIIGRVEAGEAVVVTRRGRPVARIVAVGMKRLIGEGEVRAGRHSASFPTPVKLHGTGKMASDYVSEGRR